MSLQTPKNLLFETALPNSPHILQRSLISFFLPHQDIWEKPYADNETQRPDLLRVAALILRVLATRIPLKQLSQILQLEYIADQKTKVTLYTALWAGGKYVGVDWENIHSWDDLKLYFAEH